jgi:hypothetical protein
MKNPTVLDRSGRDFVLASVHRRCCYPPSKLEPLEIECSAPWGTSSTRRGELDRHETPSSVGLGFGGYIYSRACLDVGPVGIFARPSVTERSGREGLDVPFLLVSTNDSMAGTSEWDDFFGVDSHGDAAIACRI